MLADGERCGRLAGRDQTFVLHLGDDELQLGTSQRLIDNMVQRKRSHWGRYHLRLTCARLVHDFCPTVPGLHRVRTAAT